jgi:hypothetical protein
MAIWWLATMAASKPIVMPLAWFAVIEGSPFG